MQTKPKRKKNINRTNNKRETSTVKLKISNGDRQERTTETIIDHRYIFDKQKVFVESKNNDLIISSNHDSGIQNVPESTELGDVLRELNKDVVEDNRMSGIDMRARLHFMEISNILALDTLVAFKLLPIDVLSFTRQKKRLSVSIKGEGRKEIVQIVGGIQEKDENKGLSYFDKLRGKNNNVVQ